MQTFYLLLLWIHFNNTLSSKNIRTYYFLSSFLNKFVSWPHADVYLNKFWLYLFHANIYFHLWTSLPIIRKILKQIYLYTILTLILLTWRIGWAPNNASRWQMGFNSAFKGLIQGIGTIFAGKLSTSLFLSTFYVLWTSDQLVAETSTWQHTTLTTDKYPCPRWDSNPRFQQVSGRRPLTCYYRLCCVVVCDLETSRIGAPYIYDISSLLVNDLTLILLPWRKRWANNASK